MHETVLVEVTREVVPRGIISAPKGVFDAAKISIRQSGQASIVVRQDVRGRLGE